MDGSLDEKRQQIQDLRAAMQAVEHQMRIEVSQDKDCRATASRLIDMRKDLVRLIKQRNELGGAEALLPYKERFFATPR
jgi:hypothetical protein